MASASGILHQSFLGEATHSSDGDGGIPEKEELIEALEKEEANKLNRSTMRCSYTNGNEDSPNNAKRP